MAGSIPPLLTKNMDKSLEIPSKICHSLFENRAAGVVKKISITFKLFLRDFHRYAGIYSLVF